MILAEHVVPSSDWSMRIYPIGDMHLTLRTFDERRFKEYIKTIKDDPSGVAIVMGDVSDARAKDHKYFAAEMVHPRYKIEDLDILEDKAAEEAASLFEPIAHKLAGIIRGNHHLAGFTHSLRRELRHRTGANPPDLGDRAMIRIRIRQEGRRDAPFSYSVFATHTTSTGQSKGAQVNRQHKRSERWWADLYLDAHSHDSGQDQFPRFSLSSRGSLRPVRRDATVINAGAWLKPVAFGSNSYADSKDLRPGSDVHYYADVKYHTKDAWVETIVRRWPS